MQDIIMLKRQSKRRPQFWFKAIFSLGIWLLWWRSDYLALTRRSIVRRTGVFMKEERAVPLNQVQDVAISHGVIRRILGHGDIRIETAGSGGTEIVMHNIDDPEDFRAQVFEMIDDFYEDDTKPAKPKTEDAAGEEGGADAE
ncbi:MAG: PH domain-containing protein [Anaerolineae bacterium]|nr:PH domain-containing protein [Anaerolineae bacterium]